MIDERDTGIMITITKDSHNATIDQCWNFKHINSMLTRFMLDNQTNPIYEDISEADFYLIYHEVQDLMETNYNLFEQKHFNH
jgi:hypothetical protein